MGEEPFSEGCCDRSNLLLTNSRTCSQIMGAKGVSSDNQLWGNEEMNSGMTISFPSHHCCYCIRERMFLCLLPRKKCFMKKVSKKLKKPIPFH